MATVIFTFFSASATGLLTYYFTKRHYIEDVMPDRLSALRSEIESSRSRMFEEVVLNRQLDAYEVILTYSMSLVKIAIDEINHIVHSANPIFSDGTAANRITEFRERIQDVIQGSQYLLPETLHPLLVDFLLAARQLSASLKNDPQEEIPYEQLQASRRQHLEALKATHIRIDEHIREIYSPVLENLRYELPGG